MPGVIYKHKLEIPGKMSRIPVPAGSLVIKVGYQGNDLFAWVLQEDGMVNNNLINIHIFGTGWKGIPDELFFVDTVFDPNGYVWHVFIQES